METWQPPGAAGALSEKNAQKKRKIKSFVYQGDECPFFLRILFREPDGPAAALGAPGVLGGFFAPTGKYV